jgi:hypothetical protein
MADCLNISMRKQSCPNGGVLLFSERSAALHCRANLFQLIKRCGP